jgi:hypothetical protein
MMMLNLPILVEHNNDSIVNGTILRCSPPISSNWRFNKKYIIDCPIKDLGIKVVCQMAGKNNVFHAYDLYVTSCD